MKRPAPIRPEDSLPILGMESADQERAEAAAVQLGEDLTAIMRQPIADVSAKAGELERHSPLFYGTGDNATLF